MRRRRVDGAGRATGNGRAGASSSLRIFGRENCARIIVTSEAIQSAEFLRMRGRALALAANAGISFTANERAELRQRIHSTTHQVPSRRDGRTFGCRAQPGANADLRPRLRSRCRARSHEYQCSAVYFDSGGAKRAVPITECAGSGFPGRPTHGVTRTGVNAPSRFSAGPSRDR